MVQKRNMLHLKSKALLNILVLLIIIVINGCYTKSQNISLRCVDQMYACGDCNPLFKVIDSNGEYTSIEGREVRIKFKEAELDSKYYDEVGNCQICYIGNFKGELIERRKDTIFIVESYSLELRPDCCDTTHSK